MLPKEAGTNSEASCGLRAGGRRVIEPSLGSKNGHLRGLLGFRLELRRSYRLEAFKSLGSQHATYYEFKVAMYEVQTEIRRCFLPTKDAH